MTAIGAGAAIIYLYINMDIMNFRLKDIAEYVIVCTILAVLNARILFMIAMIPSMNTVTLNELIHYFMNGGLVFYGGLFGTILGIVVISKLRKRNVKSVLNFAAPAFPLFHGFARLGCLLAGCCYGIEWSWGIILADDPDVVRFPVQAFESLCDFMIFGYLICRKRRKMGNMKSYLLSYALCRFVLEFFRGDIVRGIWIGGLSTAQYISILIIVVIGIDTLVQIRGNKVHGKKEIFL